MSATTSAALLEFQSPTAAIIARRVPVSGRITIWTIAAAIASSIAIMGLCPVDRVVTVSGKVVAKTPNLVLQPLDTSIVREIDAQEGQVVHTGEILAKLDPTFAAADAGATDAQVASLQAEVDRLTAEANGRSYLPDGTAPSELQSMVFAQRHAELAAALENYRQRIDSGRAKVAQTVTDIANYSEEYRVAQKKEGIRQQLERLQVGSKLSTLDANAQRAEVNRALQGALSANDSAKGDLDALIAERDAYVQKMKGEAEQQLAEQGRKLAEAEGQRNKANLRQQWVTLKADRDAVVLSVARVSVGSVVQSGEELISLVPLDAPLKVEASVPGNDAGFVQPGNAAVIKFNTFPYTTYGYATGTLQTVSADSFVNSGTNTRGKQDEIQSLAGDAATFFKVSVSLDEVKLHNLPAGFRMSAGMPVTTDIKVGERTVLSYLLARAVPTLTEAMREP